MRNIILFTLAWTFLLLPICCLQDNKSLVSVEEGDWGSGDPVINDIQKVNLYRVTPDDTESSGDDVEDVDIDVISGGGGSGNGEGSGSGEDQIGNVTLVGPHSPTYIPVTTTATATVDTINNGTTSEGAPTETATTKTADGFVATTFQNIDDNQVDPTDNDTVITLTHSGALPSAGGEDDGNSGVNFTVAIIVGVVVGAILSVLIIVCLVYRLRKKDEGSYSLEEPSTAMLRNDTDSPTPKGT